MNVLLLIDLQYDFCPGGALPVEGGDEVVPLANALMAQYPLVVATQDWHPADHGSFAAMHLWRKPGQVIELNGLQQVLWPTHCVQETFGAQLVAGLDKKGIHRVFYKGTDPGLDSYSGFFDNGRRQSTGLGEWLREQGAKGVHVMGLATDYCVKHTVLDALSLGFETHVLAEGCRGVDLNLGDSQRALEEMAAAGALIR
jgi:nicotinamidase/pyrazinamidase